MVVGVGMKILQSTEGPPGVGGTQAEEDVSLAYSNLALDHLIRRCNQGRDFGM